MAKNGSERVTYLSPKIDRNELVSKKKMIKKYESWVGKSSFKGS